jgi:hypothetical protein
MAKMTHMTQDMAHAAWFALAIGGPRLIAADQISPILNLVLALVGAVLAWLASRNSATKQ